MSDAFDPYHRWLGIPPEEQPPHHYRLLGINAFEADPEVIRDAATQRMAHVRTYQLGQYQAISQKILNELAAAKACLLDPQKKAAYDAQLRQKLAQPVKVPRSRGHQADGQRTPGTVRPARHAKRPAHRRRNLVLLRKPPARETAPRRRSPGPRTVQGGQTHQVSGSSVYQGKTKGLVFGEYRVLDKLGEGGMGVVLKAQHQRMDRIVAVKMISAAQMKSPDAVNRFYREVKAAAKLNHPNIVQAYDASEHDGMHYLVMEYVEGKDLAALVKEKGPAAHRPSRGVRRAGCPRSAICPRTRHRPPRHQARQPPVGHQGHGQNPRHGAGTDRSGLAGGRGQRAVDRQRSGVGHLRLHGSRAGSGHPPRRCAVPTSTRWAAPSTGC